ncbi:MAG: TlpA family protein disulfide reductase [Vicinamibacteraceae bacterium]
MIKDSYAMTLDHSSTYALASALLMLAGSGSLADAAQPERHQALPFVVGQPLPGLILPDLADGRPRSIAELRGQKLILHIFASW